MGDGDVAAREEKVGHVDGIQRPVGDAVGRGRRAADVGVARVVKAARVVVVQRPAAIGDHIREPPAGKHVALRHDHGTHHAAGFPLAGKKTDPLRLPEIRVWNFSAVLDIVCHAVSERQQLVPDFFCVVDRIPVAAQLQVPEILTAVFHLRHPQPQLLRRQFFGPCRRDKPGWPFGFAHLDQTAHPHGLPISGMLRGLFSKLGGRFPPHAVLRPGQRGQHAVSGAVREQRGVDFVHPLGRSLPAGDGRNTVAVHCRVEYGTVEQQRDVRLAPNLLVQDGVPRRVELVGIAVKGGQLDLLKDAGLPVVAALCAADPHTDLRRGVAAQHRSVVNQRDLGTAPGCGDGGAHSGQSAADHAKIYIMFYRLKSHTPSVSSIPVLRHFFSSGCQVRRFSAVL